MIDGASDDAVRMNRGGAGHGGGGAFLRIVIYAFPVINISSHAPMLETRMDVVSLIIDHFYLMTREIVSLLGQLAILAPKAIFSCYSVTSAKSEDLDSPSPKITHNR